MKKSMIVLLASFLLLGVWGETTQAAWPDDPASNLLLYDAEANTTMPIVKTTSDGGCYTLFYNNGSGNYDTYLQHVSPDGTVSWEDGLAVSTYTNSSMLFVWGFNVDNNDNAIIAVNDLRHGSTWDITAYSIASDGTFNWGADGINFTNDELPDVAQKMVGTSDGGAAYTWTKYGSQYIVHVQKLNQDGSTAFGPIQITAEYNTERSDIVATSDGGVIVVYIVRTSSGSYAPSHIYAQRFSSSGETMWADGGVGIETVDGFSRFDYPTVMSDGENGVVVAWNATVSGANNVFIQHVNSNGNLAWGEGSRVDLVSSDAQLQTLPSIAYDAENSVRYIFYQTANTVQTEWGIGAQKVSADGSLLWGDDGISVVDLNVAQPKGINALMLPDGNVNVTYLQNTGVSDAHSLVKSITLDGDGNPVWDTSPMILCSVESSKLYMTADVTSEGRVIATWIDERSGETCLYLQHVNPDGTLGEYSPPEPEIAIDSPSTGASFNLLPITVTYTATDFVVAESDGDGLVKVTVSGSTTSDDFTTAEESIPISNLEGGENTITLELVDYDGNSLDPAVSDNVTVTYSAPTVTITSPDDNATVNSSTVEVAFDIANFTLGSEGDGYLSVVLNSGDADYVGSTDPIAVTDLVDGSNTIVLELVDADHNSFDPQISATLNLTYTLPTITISSPSDGQNVNESEVAVAFELTSFTLGDEGDGYLLITLNSGEPQQISTTGSVTVSGLTEGENTIVLELVDSEQNTWVPQIQESVRVTYVINAVAEQGELPTEYSMSSAWPNPFNPSTTLRFAMKQTGHIRLSVYDVLGREVAELVNGTREAGYHKVSWHAEAAPSGVYFVRMTTNGFVTSQKITRMK